MIYRKKVYHIQYNKEGNCNKTLNIQVTHDTGMKGQSIIMTIIWKLFPNCNFCQNHKWTICIEKIYSAKTHGMSRAFMSVFINTLRPRQNGRHFADDTFKHIFLKENIRISINISLKFVPKSLINNIPALVQIMAWRRPGDKPLSEPMMDSLPTNICVIRPQWVNSLQPNITSRVWLILCAGLQWLVAFQWQAINWSNDDFLTIRNKLQWNLSKA